MQYDTSHPPQCKKCGRHEYPIKTIRIDPTTHKKWVIYKCPKCEYESDLEPYHFKSHKNYDEFDSDSQMD